MKHISGVLIVGLVVLLSSCTSVKQSQDSPKEVVLSEQQKFDFTYSFFEANKYQLKGNFDLAVGLYQKCIEIDISSSAVYYNLSKIYLQKNDFIVAENYSSKAIYYNNGNSEYLALAAIIYQKNGKYDEAEKIYSKLIDSNKSNVEYYLGLADLYLQKKEYKLAIKVYDNVDLLFGVSELISLQKNKIYISLNDYSSAKEELVKLAKANNNSPQYLRMIADFNVQIKKYDDAIVIYKSIISNYPNDGYSHIGLAECYQQKGDFETAFGEIKLAFESTEVPSEVKINLFLTIWQTVQNQPELSSILYDLTKVLVEKYPDNADVNTIYADFLLRNNELDKAREVLRSILQVRKDKYMLWEQLVLIDNEFLDWESCYIDSKDALKYFPNQSLLYFFKGFSAFQLEKFNESFKSLDFGFKLITKEDVMYKDFLTFLAEVNHRLGYNDKAYEYYDELLLIDSENIMVLNNYAYYLSEEDGDLNKAKSMSFKTIDKEPENSTYLDTYAWILFRLKEYSDALVYIEKAYKYNKDSSAVIIEHYGDILFHNKNKDGALKYWKEAKELGKGTDLLDAKIEKETYLD